MRTDDGSIIQTCLNNEPEAFGVLVDKYKAGIFAYVYARVNNFQDAQEITQDVFLCAYSGLHSLKRYESFSFWLFRIASNRCKRWQRNQIRHPQPEFIDDIDPKAIDSSSIKSHHEEMMDQSVREALNTLPETYREVLMLYYFSDMDSKEIAESLGISPTAIRMRLSRAREYFKEEMIAMMGTAFEHERLRASFTFRIVEAIKRIKVQPISQTKGLPWGISLATGLIFTVLSFNSNMIPFNWFNINSVPTLSSETKVLKVGEIPVNVLKASQIVSISSNIGKGKGGNPKNDNAFLMAPQAVDGKWEKRTDMPTARYAMASAVLDGNIYVIGGSNIDGVYLKTVEMYDPRHDSWETKASIAQGNACLGAAVVNGKIYVIGGNDNGNIDLSTVEEYDPVKDTWTNKANMPTARYWVSTAVVDGIIYAIGGIIGVSYCSIVEAYNPVTNQWSSKANLPLSGFCWSAVVDGKIYSMGWSDNALNALHDVYEYDPILNIWTRKADMPTARRDTSVDAIDGKIYVVGGITALPFTMTSKVEIYDPKTDTWDKGTDLGNARTYHVSGIVDGKIYIIGGLDGGFFNIQTTVEVFDTGLSVSPQGKLPNTWGKLKTK